jgi:DNA-binding MarR family transcriptional regulator
VCITFSVFFLFFLKSMQPELNAILTLGGGRLCQRLLSKAWFEHHITRLKKRYFIKQYRKPADRNTFLCLFIIVGMIWHSFPKTN